MITENLENLEAIFYMHTLVDAQSVLALAFLVVHNAVIGVALFAILKCLRTC